MAVHATFFLRWLVLGAACAVGAAACGDSDRGNSGNPPGSAGQGGTAGAPGGSGATSSGGTAAGGAGGFAGSSGAGAAASGGTPAAGSAGSSGSDASGEAGASGAAGEPGSAGGAAGEGGAGGEGNAGGVAGQGGDGGEGGEPEPVLKATKLDLLFVVDNSISMFEKQGFLSTAVPTLVSRLIAPYCVDGATLVPPDAEGNCAPGQRHELDPVEDMHVGVISTSLGARGSGDAGICATAANPTRNYDDRAHLLPFQRTEPLASWNGSGFLKWDPKGLATPAGESDAIVLTANLRQMIEAAGTFGCGYESPLEAFYRFLVDPEPPLVVGNDGTRTTVSTAPENIDTQLLAQRAAFLRPDSALIIVVLSDENDCSIVAEPNTQGWLVGYMGQSPGTFRMPRATAVCAEAPNDPCCAPCGSLPTGCTSPPECATPFLSSVEDSMNLRCFEQKQRFGVDFLYPIERYVTGLGDERVPRRSGGTAENPLFAGGRDPSLVVLTNIVGLPWQDVAVDPDDGEQLELMTANELESAGRWPVLVGDFENGEPPADPFMIESVDPRSGQNPITMAPIVPATSTDPLATINGHEQLASSARDDLQYACIFPLPVPITCTTENAEGCDCNDEELPTNKPLCQQPGSNTTGTTQYFGKAYPALRQLELSRRLGERSVVASICPRDSINVASADYGYLPAMRALQKHVRTMLIEQ